MVHLHESHIISLWHCDLLTTYYFAKSRMRMQIREHQSPKLAGGPQRIRERSASQARLRHDGGCIGDEPHHAEDDGDRRYVH